MFGINRKFDKTLTNEDTQKKLHILEAAIDNAKEAVYIIDEFNNYRFLYVNDAACNMLGYSREEFLQMNVSEIEAKYSNVEIAQQAKMKEKITFNTLHKAKDGHLVGVHISGSVFEYDNFPFRIAIAQDITDISNLQKKLKEKEQEFSMIAEASPGAISSFHIDKNGKSSFRFISENIFELFGIEAEEIYKDASLLLKAVHLKDRKKVKKSIFVATYAKNDWYQEFRINHPTKGVRWMESHAKYRYNSDDFIWYGFVYDITQRKNNECELYKQKEMFRNLAENTKDMIVRYDLDCRRTYINQAGVELLGRDKEQLLGQTPSEYSAMLANQEFEEKMREVIATGRAMDIKEAFVRANGKIGWGSQHIIPEKDEHGEVKSLLVIGRDLTELKHKERFLMEKEQLFRTLVENSPDAIVRYDREGNRIYANPTFLKETGLTHQDINGKPFSDISSEQMQEYSDKLHHVMNDDVEDEMKLHWTNMAGEHRVGHIRFVPEKDVFGLIVGAMATGRDITMLQ
ncbi:PAS domain-containing protein [Sulfurimonas sp.]|uniref:PAS domain-containing protein n=1 Tax=Sulfurimonas sp. TaxID=2022749 RepID=UPI003D0B2671